MATKKKISDDVIRFSKEQLLASQRFANSRDLITALLDDGAKYTIEEAEKKIRNFLKGKVI